MRRLPIIFILVTLVIDAMGIGLILPVMPDLIREVNGGDLAQAAVWGGILSTSFAVMQFILGPTIGSLSDRFGRRPILLISLGVMVMSYLVMAIAGSIWLLLLSRLVGGAAAATQSTAAAFMADISKPEEKAANFGLVGAAFGIGFVIGPLLGGLLGEFGARAPFYTAAALALINMIFGYFVLTETVTNRIRRPFEWRRANPFGAFRHIGKLPGVGRLLLMFLIYQIAFMVYPSIWAYFTQARFGWNPFMVGISLASFGISTAFVQGVLIRLILKRLGDRNTVIYGIAFNFFSFAAMALVTSGTLALILTPLTALGVVATPALQGMMSRIADSNQQGELQGVLASVSALAMIISPMVMTQTFAFFAAPDAPVYAPGAPFLLSMILMAVCGAIFMGRRRRPAMT